MRILGADFSWLSRWLRTPADLRPELVELIQPTLRADFEWPLPLRLVNDTQTLVLGDNVYTYAPNDGRSYRVLYGELSVSVARAVGVGHRFANTITTEIYEGAAATLHIPNWGTAKMIIEPPHRLVTTVRAALAGETYTARLVLLERPVGATLEFN